MKTGEFQQFSLIVKNPDQTGEIVWDAYQYYADGELVEWDGEMDGDTPHSVTKIEKNTAGQVVSEHGSTVDGLEKETSQSWMLLSIVLAVLSLILSMITGIIVWKWRGHKK